VLEEKEQRGATFDQTQLHAHAPNPEEAEAEAGGLSSKSAPSLDPNDDHNITPPASSSSSGSSQIQGLGLPDADKVNLPSIRLKGRQTSLRRVKASWWGNEAVRELSAEERVFLGQADE
jgi:hypothetical protein